MFDMIKQRKEWVACQKKADALSTKVGAVAPDFELHDVNGENPIHLYDFRDRKPVALMFGSFT